MARIRLEDIKKELQREDWSVISDKYKNLNTPMIFKCNEGHQVTTTWKKLRKRLFCPVCDSNEKRSLQGIKAFKKESGAYRVLALDQSSKKTGYSIYDNQELIAYGVFSTTKQNVFDRMTDLCDWVLSMVVAWEPDLVGLEDVQYNPNAGAGHDVFKMLAQIMGSVIITILREKIEVEPVNISRWRGHCGVKGRTRQDKKRSAQLLVKKWFDITLSDDEADAICIGKFLAESRESDKVIIGEWID